MTAAAPELLVDLHVHSRYSRSCSRASTPQAIALWARRKGLAVVGTVRLFPEGRSAVRRARRLPS